MFEAFLIIMIFVWPGLILPAILGSLILVQYGHEPVGKMAGAFTLKPLVATPLWALIFAFGSTMEIPFDTTQVLSWIPPVALTLILLLVFRKVFATDRGIALLLLITDVVRWMIVLVAIGLNRALGGMMFDVYLAGVVISNLYAAMAIFLLWLRTKKQNEAAVRAS